MVRLQHILTTRLAPLHSFCFSSIFETTLLESRLLLLSFFGKGRGLQESSVTSGIALPEKNQPSQPPDQECAGLEQLQFRYPLRQYQKEIIELVKLKLERGERRLHIVAPPGAGKTIIGLQLIAEFKQPSLVVCPTTTIQAQWGQKLELFAPPELGLNLEDVLGTHEDRPLKPITLLTYQVLSTTASEHEYLSKLAHDGWIRELTSGSGLSHGQAELRIIELLQNNRRAYDKELSRHVSHLRRKLSDIIDPKEILHKNALALLQAFRRQGFKTVIFDECHHLTDYWAAVMKHVVGQLEEPLVIGLTGTPPEGKSSTQATRYLSLVGDIDYQVPTPALVREGGLAPFQDLVIFTEPTAKEEEFLAGQHEEFHVLLEQLIAAQPPLLNGWVRGRLHEESPKRESYLSKRPDLKAAMTRFAWRYKLDLPMTVSLSESLRQSPLIDDWMLILEDFALNFLKVSASSENHQLYEKIRSAITKLGFGLTERGVRKQASPVDRVLAFSRSKSAAVAEILRTEYESLDDRLRAAVITDFEKMSATAVKTAKGVLTQESGGAVAVLRELLAQPIGYYVNPCLVTGSLLLVDRNIAAQFVEAAAQYFSEEGIALIPEIREHRSSLVSTDSSDSEADQAAEGQELFQAAPFEWELDPCSSDGIISYDGSDQESPAPTISLPKPDLSGTDGSGQQNQCQPYVEITAGGTGWEARTYVGMATALLERGITKCLIGTRGIFGEGWDCQSLNTLIDLTTTTTPMSVKQLRGRSIRLNVDDPLGARKVANNWDVVCIAPHLEKGLNDYQRFARKHQGFFGIADDGQIECGVGHVHPSFSDLTPAEIFQQYEQFNGEMIERALCREQIYDLWKVGHPYKNRSLGCIEVSSLRKLSLTPPNLRRNLSYREHAQLMRASLDGLWLEYGLLGSVCSGLMTAALAHFGMPLFLALLPLLSAASLGRWRYSFLHHSLKTETCRPNTQESSLIDMSVAILTSLQQAKLLPRYLERTAIKVSQRSDGSFRVFLDDAEQQHSEYFTKSLKELLAPITNQPYLIPKYEFFFPRKTKAQARSQNKVVEEKAIASPESSEQPVIISTATFADPRDATDADFKDEAAFFKAYLKCKAQPRVAAYHPVPSLLARSEKGRSAFQSAWNKYVSPGDIIQTQTNEDLLRKYFGTGPSLSQRLLWE
jgi:superfamily II DNA or RNA helicase